MSKYPSCFEITVLHDLRIDPIICESCVNEAIKARTNNVELRQNNLNVFGEFVPHAAHTILNSIQNEIDLGNVFLECIDRTTEDATSILNGFEKTMPQKEKDTTADSKTVYCKICKKLGIKTAFTNLWPWLYADTFSG